MYNLFAQRNVLHDVLLYDRKILAWININFAQRQSLGGKVRVDLDGNILAIQRRVITVQKGLGTCRDPWVERTHSVAGRRECRRNIHSWCVGNNDVEVMELFLCRVLKRHACISDCCSHGIGNGIDRLENYLPVLNPFPTHFLYSSAIYPSMY